MAASKNEILQIKSTLQGIRPPIWRRIQIPASETFWGLHCAIQDAMGWDDMHLHSFRARHRKYGDIEIRVPWDGEENEEFLDFLPDWECKIRDCLRKAKDQCLYKYDFGDGWKHIVELEKILPAEPDVSYPVCVTGRRACPPEDCGGVWGYMRLLEALKNPENVQHKELLEWLGDRFDPEAFDPDAVRFTDPEERMLF